MSHRPELSTSRWKTLRKLILERDSYVCWMCGKRADQVDHLIPPWAGGSDEPENLAAACGSCNNRKHHRYVDLPVLTIQW
jgi:5-methylcytosine-specific restriction endonuclease McrA